ncbi:hypothetical protein ACN38_g7661 [Penicillium nordicum]|uniref:Uncharacterized protein n=1 Tax=Penicillium nordicum TaxID=229535 RepID=A0A0M9WE73_9EURO|nr:hypothetical protein ACN38_g7661 [Penicillium nordicum]
MIDGSRAGITFCAWTVTLSMFTNMRNIPRCLSEWFRGNIRPEFATLLNQPKASSLLFLHLVYTYGMVGGDACISQHNHPRHA